MKTRRLIGVVAVLALSGLGAPARRVAARSIACEALTQVALTNGTIISSQAVQAGAFTLPSGGNAAASAAFATTPAFCRVIAKLTESFAAVRKALEDATAGGLSRDVEFFGRRTTVRGILTEIDTHVAEHMGQAIAYARMNGIVPPWSR